MKKALYTVLFLLLAVSCGPRRIGREDMEEIMYQVLIQDQQIKHDYALKARADTCLIYEGIFEEFGYDTDDFLYSLEYYLAEPAKFEKIMEKVGDRLDAEYSDVHAQVERIRWRARMMGIYKQQIDSSMRPWPRVRPVDTLVLRFEGDSFRIVLPEDSLLRVSPDSLLFVRDSL